MDVLTRRPLRTWTSAVSMAWQRQKFSWGGLSRNGGEHIGRKETGQELKQVKREFLKV